MYTVFIAGKTWQIKDLVSRYDEPATYFQACSYNTVLRIIKNYFKTE